MLTLFFSAFLCFGVMLVLVGANQAGIARDLNLDLARSGLLTSALGLGLGIGVVGAGPLFDRFPRRPLFVGSALFTAAALLSVDSATGFTRLLVHLALTGVGAGAYDTLINAVVAERYHERAARPMSIVHSGATCGAVLGPLLIAWLASDGDRADWTASFRWVGASHVALAVCACFFTLPAPPPRHPASRGIRSALSLALLPLAGVAFAYVGVEATLTIFAVPYAAEALSLGTSRGQLGISAFWFGLFAGRIAVLALRRPLDARVLAGSGLLASFALALGVGFDLPQLELLLASVGLALGCVYPVMIALVGQRFPEARGTAAGLAAGAGALGGFCIPWLTGALGDWIGIAAAVGSLGVWTTAIAAAALASGPPLRSEGVRHQHG